MEKILFEAIEHPNFSAQLNVVSGYRQFVRALTSAPELQELIGSIKVEDDVEDVLKRLVLCTKAPCEPGYEHPHDVALAAYLVVLNQLASPTSVRAGTVVKQCVGCHWARKVAEQLLARPATASTGQSETDLLQPATDAEARM
jgi:hypothetical protein